MSSPVAIQTPTPARPQRSIAGPVVLIALGVVFLLGTMGVLHWANLWNLYGQYWPVLIIVWGVIKLVEHQRAQRQAVRASGIGVGGVFLLLFLICTGVIASETRKVNWQSLHDEIGIDDEDFGNWFGQSFTYTDAMTESFPAGGSLHVISDRGAIHVMAAEGKELKVEISKKVHADNQQDADRYNLQTKPQVTTSGSSVTINANTKAAGEHGVSTDLNIYVPASAPLVISSRHGDVSISGWNANVEVSAQHGETTLENIKGNATLELQRSSAKLSNISGDLSISGRVNEVTATNVRGSARLTGEFMESVKLGQIGRTVAFKSSRTDMEMAKLDGSLELDSGDLRADSIQGPIRLTTHNKDVRLEAVSGDLRLEDKNGTIEIVLLKPGNLQVDNKNGDIQITLPNQAAFRLDARAVNGEIQTDFPQIQVNNNGNQAAATGTIGGGTALLKVTNEHGTIEIHKGSVEAKSSSGRKPSSRDEDGDEESPEPTEN